MKKILIITLTITILIGGSLYYQNQSSYSEYMTMQEGKINLNKLLTTDNSPKDVETGTENSGKGQSAGDAELDSEKTPEDIALDKRLDEERKKNERTYREQGITGTSIRPTIEVPSPSMEDIIGIYKTVDAYMRENSDRYPEPADDGTRGNTDDPRIQKILYVGKKTGIIADFKNENLVAWEVKKLDGEYTNLLLGRKSAGEEWKVLFEGDVYQLRKEISDGN